MCIRDSFRRGDTFDDTRASLALTVSSFLQAAASKSNYAFEVAITAPYSDLVNTVEFRFDRRGLSSAIGKPRITTVQSIIGGEADVVVTMLGKEWSLEDLRLAPPSYRQRAMMDFYETLYPREPEVLNVQLSRHKSMLVVIGNIGRLRWLRVGRDDRIAKTGERLLSLVEEGKAVYVNLRS